MRGRLAILLTLTLVAASDLDLPPFLPPPRVEPQRLPEVPRVQLPPLDPRPPVFFGEEIPLERNSLVYVLDYSQSMGAVFERVDFQTTRNRWQRVQLEAARSITGLDPALRFGVIVFGTGGGCGVMSWRSELTNASAANKAAALAWLDGFRDVGANGGATPTAPAVLVGFELHPGSVLLLTDGSPSFCGFFRGTHPSVSHRERIAAANTEHVRVDVFQIGQSDSYASDFCRGVASDSGGTFVRVQ